MNTWAVLIVMSFITYLNRFLFLFPKFRYEPSERVKRFLSFASLSVLTVIWVPLVVQYNGGQEQGGFLIGIDYAVGAIMAVLLSLFRVHSLLVLALSFGAFWTFRMLV